MEKEETLTALSALAHEGRFDLFRHLIQAGPRGLAAGQLADAMDANFTTISAQLSTLAQAQLVSSERQGRSIIYKAEYGTIRGVIMALMADCCQGQPTIISPIIDAFSNPSCCPPKRSDS